MNETTQTNNNSNGARPIVDHRGHAADISDQSVAGKAPLGAAPMNAPAPSRPSTTSVAPVGGTQAPMASPRPVPAAPMYARLETPKAADNGSAQGANAQGDSKSTAVAAAPAMLDKVVQGAHDTVERIADSAAPAVQKLGERVAATEDAVHARADQLRKTRDELTASVRSTVAGNPLVSVAIALVVGAFIARIRR